MRKLFLFTIINASILCSCTKYKLKELVDTHIIFPEALYSIDQNQLKKTTIQDGKNKIIVWFDSTGCNTCKALDLYNFDFVYDYCKDSLNSSCDFIAVFSPTKEQINDVAVILWERNINIPFVIDVNNEFHKLNSTIPDNELYHSFLLNDCNNIVIVGRPNYNLKMWNLYKSMINNNQ